MSDFKLPQHGRDHRPGIGSDPIPGIGGDYVFLSEITLADDGDPLVFPDIDQGFRHLEIIGSLAVPGSGSVQKLVIFMSGEADPGYYSFASADSDPATYSATDNPFIECTGILPSIDLLGEIPNYNGFSARFPYYSLAGRSHTVLWQAFAVYDAGSVRSSSGGGINNKGDDDTGSSDPVTQITLESRPSGPLAAGSYAALYGIR